MAKIQEHAPLLIKAAEALRDLVKELNEADEIKGYIVYSNQDLPEKNDESKE